MSPIDFLEFATYNRLFSYVTISKPIAEWLLREGRDVCFVEVRENETYNVWYPKIEWDKETNRRKSVQQVFPKTKKELMALLIQATMKQDKQLMQTLMKEIENAK